MMIGHYLKFSLKSVLGGRLYSAINLLGMSVGLASFLLISLFVSYELSWDNHFTNSEDIYRISPDFAAGQQGTERHPAGNVAAFGPLIKTADHEGVEEVARMGAMHAMIATDTYASWEDNFRFADPSLFSIFSFTWERGNAASALEQPDSVVISSSIAQKYFGSTDVLGNTLKLDNTWPLTVTGVIADLPQNSHFRADLIVPMSTGWKLLDFDYSDNWGYTIFHTYLKLTPGTRIEPVMQSLRNAVAGFLALGSGESYGIAPGELDFTAYQLQDIHLTANRQGELTVPGNSGSVLMFSTIAVGLLLMACINFMNLSTARASTRAREVGMHKVVGATRRELIARFLCDSFLLTFLALVVAFALVEILLPAFSNVIGRPLEFSMILKPGFLSLVLGVTLAAALVAGSYPAFHLSAFNPARTIRMQRGEGGSKFTIRNVLVIFQFSMSVILLICTLVVSLQMQFVRNFDLGFSKDQVMVLWGTHFEGLGRQWEVMKSDLREHPDVLNVAEGVMSPGSAGTFNMRIDGGAPEELTLWTKQVGFEFFDTYDIALVAGRDFDAAISTDQLTPPPNLAEGESPRASYILNEAAVRALNLSANEALGRTLEMDFSTDFSFTIPGPIIGVVEDIHLHSLHEPVRPLVYFVPQAKWGALNSFDIASVRLSGRNTAATVQWVEEKWQQLVPENPFIFHFLNDEFEALYMDEELQGDIFSFFSVLTMFIACMGLLGMATFNVERRVKEIGVRKVMGGSVWSIVVLLTNDFSRLVLLSNIIAWPVAYFAMNRWLENFAYRIDLTPLIFIGSGLIALCIAWVTVGGTAAKAASRKPVLALRYE